MLTSPELSELAKALAAAQLEIKAAPKDAANPYFKSTYSTLGAVWDACKVPLAKQGLTVIQVPEMDGPDVLLITRLLHISGQWIEGTYPVNPIKQDPQGIGSALSYAKRYALMAMIGIASEDDDGNAASDKEHEKAKHVPAPQPLPAKAVVAKPKTLDHVPIPDHIPVPTEKPEAIALKARTTARSDELKKLCIQQKWTIEEVVYYCKHAFKEEKPTQLGPDEYEKLKGIIRELTPPEALESLNKPETMESDEEMFK